MSNIDLAAVALGDGGTIFAGVEPLEVPAYPAPAGDVNGDGIDDFHLGAQKYLYGDRGMSYTFFGGQDYVFDGDRYTAPVPLEKAKGDLVAFKIVGGSDATYWYVRSAGDVNNDGLQDVIVGTPTDNAGGVESGAAFVVFGRGEVDTVLLSEVVDDGGGFKIQGTLTGGALGLNQSFTGIGDVNGDGFADLLVASPTTGPGSGPGIAHVVFGKADTGTVDLDTVTGGAGGFRILPEAGTLGLGTSVATVGDVNDDGIGDFGLVSSGSGGVGAFAYIIHGRASDSSDIDLADVAAGTGGFRITPEAGDSFYAAGGIQAAGDVNGDGIDDLVVTTPDNDAGGADAGAAYIIFGAAGGLGAVDLADIAAGIGGYKIIGETAGGLLGPVWSLGDVNGDGLADLLLGAPGGAGDDGAAYVVYGQAGTAAIDLADVAVGAGGFKIEGYGGLQVGAGVAALGDVTGDGLVDIGIGTLNWVNHRGILAGGMFLIDGAMLTQTEGQSLVGSAAGETIEGGSRADTIDGMGGHDLIRGGFGMDVLIGGTGNDTLIGGTANDSLNGGAGNDSLDGGSGADTLAGGVGNDTYVVDHVGDVIIELAGEGGADLVYSSITWVLGANLERLVLTGNGNTRGEGNGLDNSITGNARNNSLLGQAGNDSLFGLDGDDRLDGGTGNDALIGGAGNDNLIGGAGNDSLDGGIGTDTLAGGTGNDTLKGGVHADLFVFATGSGQDIIVDFQPGTDRISLVGLGFADFAAVLAATEDTGGGARIALTPDLVNTVLLAGITEAQLGAGDFIL